MITTANGRPVSVLQGRANQGYSSPVAPSPILAQPITVPTALQKQPVAVSEQRTESTESAPLQRPPLPPQQTITQLTPPVINMGLGLKLNP
jgi:hypothetical protein